MIRCIPKGVCSWDFFLDGEGHQGSLEFNWFGEQGVITADHVRFGVRKHGALSGHWTLNQDRESVASAQKSGAFTRTFEIQDAEQTLLLRADSAPGRSFRVERAGEVIVRITPEHALTHRATIETLGQKCGFRTVCFAFWLAVLMWRRAAASG